MVTRTIGFFSLAEAPVELPAEHAELEGHVADRHACGDVWKVSGHMPVTNIPSARSIANIAVNDAMILPYDAIQGPDGIFGKDSLMSHGFCRRPRGQWRSWSSPSSPASQ
jgi:hypothetical protein